MQYFVGIVIIMCILNDAAKLGVNIVNKKRAKVTKLPRIVQRKLTHFAASLTLLALLVAGCAGMSPTLEQLSPLPASEMSPSLLSGLWEYQEGALVHELRLDDRGNGTYNWHHGNFRTTGLVHSHWVGTWHQPGNDREGEFEAELAVDGLSAEGQWWYSRIGSDEDPLEIGGHFSLIRKDF